MDIRERAKKLKNEIPAVFLCLKDKETPVLAKVLAAFTVAYALSPIDFIPDFIPVIGFLDDIILLPVMIYFTVKLIPDSIWEKNLRLSQGMWKNGKPEKWYYGLPIIVFWLIILIFLGRSIYEKLA